MDTATVAKMFGCTEDQAKAQYLKGADVLDRMAEKAGRTGRKVNGYDAATLRAMADDQRKRAA